MITAAEQYRILVAKLESINPSTIVEVRTPAQQQAGVNAYQDAKRAGGSESEALAAEEAALSGPAPAPAAAAVDTAQVPASANASSSYTGAPAPAPTPVATPAAPINRDSMTFGQAFADARAKGEKQFNWKGKPYAVKLAPAKAKPAQAGMAKPVEPGLGQTMDGMDAMGAPGTYGESKGYNELERIVSLVHHR